MQVPKEEIKNDIITAAEYEFLKHGYRNASLRTIAKKANTTLGNLYNYFPNKEAILDQIVGDTPEVLSKFANSHGDFDFTKIDIKQITVSNLGSLMDQILPQLIDLDLILSNVVVILLEGCENTKYEGFRTSIHDLFKEHMSGHLRNDPDEIFTEIVVQTMISGIIYVAKLSSSKEVKKRSLLKYFNMLIYGLFFGTDFSFTLTNSNEA